MVGRAIILRLNPTICAKPNIEVSGLLGCIQTQTTKAPRLTNVSGNPLCPLIITHFAQFTSWLYHM